MKIVRSSLLAFLVFASCLGSAHGLTGTDLYTQCFSKPELSLSASDSSFCYGYLQGALETVLFEEAIVDNGRGGSNLKFVCTADTLKMQQVFLIVRKYLSDNPDKLHWAAALLVHNAMQAAFPCK